MKPSTTVETHSQLRTTFRGFVTIPSARHNPVLVLLQAALLVLTLLPVYAFSDEPGQAAAVDVDDSVVSEDVGDEGVEGVDDDPARIAGLSWIDTNGDGVLQSDEEFLEGVELVLIDGEDSEVDSVVTDETGEFVFDGVEPGEYRLQTQVPDGLEATPIAVVEEEEAIANSFAVADDDVSVVSSEPFSIEAGDDVSIHLGLSPAEDATEEAEELDGEEVEELDGEADESGNEDPPSEEEAPVFAPLSANPPDTGVRATTLFAYVGAGESLDVAFTEETAPTTSVDGVVSVAGPGFAEATCTIPQGSGETCSWTELTGDPGVWQINLSTGLNPLYTWEVDVVDGDGSIDGRVWSELYRMRQLPGPESDVDATFWFVADTGYLYEATYYDYNGINSDIYADATGVALVDSCTSAYKSWDDGGTPNSDPNLWVPPPGECGDLFKMFFEEPDPELPAIADRWDGATDWILPTTTTPDVTSVTFTPDSMAVHSGDISYEVDSFSGQLFVEIDTDNNGTFDVGIPGSAFEGAGSVHFDGFDGNDDPVSPFQEMAVRVSILQAGEIHFSNWDVEIRSGIEVTRLNGPNPGDQTLYWDDTDLVVAGRDCVTPVLDGAGGVNSAGGVHGWDCRDNPNDGVGGSWGDQRYIDNWTFVALDVSEEIVVPAQEQPTWACTAEGILGQGSPATFFAIDLVSGEATELFTADHDWNINAFGYNVLDDYIYGYVPAAGQNQIVRVGSDGSVVELGRPAGIPEGNLNTGDVDEDGFLWLSSQAEGGIGWFKVDVIPGSPTYLEVVESGPVVGYGGTVGGPDWGYVPGGGDYLYRINRSSANDESLLFRFDRETHVHELIGSLGDLGGSNTFGAVYADADGFLYGSNNQTGQIWRIDVHAPSASLFADGPASASNDGAMCIDATVYTDYGDAPESYGTLLADDGPRHSLRDYDPDTNATSLMLGEGVSHETDGQPSAGADADTFDDGVTDQIVRVIGQETEVEVLVTNDTDEPATLAGWIDLDHNGTFDGSDLRWLVVPPNTTDTFTLTWPAPALPGDGTYARFRLFPGEVAEGDISPTGPASAGEVEDYMVVGPVAVNLQCPVIYAQQGGSPYSIYEVDTSTGNMAVVGQFAPGSGTNNGLGISADARYFFGHRDGEVLRFDSESGVTDAFPGVPGLNSTHGGVDPQSGIYYYGNIGSGVFAFDPATETDLGQVATLAFDIAPAGGNGDWSFDAQGNLYLVAGSPTDSSLYVVSGLPTTSQPTPVGVTGQRITTFDTGGAAVNGMAFDATGSLYAASNAIIFEIDPATGDILDQQSLSPSGVSVDLASCSTPPSIVVQKDIADRFDPGDQFEVTVTGGGISENNVGTTTGSDTGLHTEPGEFAGPVLGRPGTTYDIGETGVNGADLANYSTSWQCVDWSDDDAVVAEGEGASGSFVMPTSLVGAAIVCTFLNEPAGHMVTKSSDPQSGTTLRPGDTVTYTLTLTNLGTVDLFDVEAEDDLGGVFDDAELTSGPVVDPVDAGTAEIVDDTLAFIGDLPAGEQVTVTYAVTVLETSDADGDGVLTNAVTSPGAVNCPVPAVTDPQDPEFDPDCVTEHPVRDLTIVKSSDPGDGTAVAPGDTVAYTLEITNTGGYDYTMADPAEISDDLTGVIDDASYNNDADSGGVGSVSYAAPVLTWTGPLASGDSVTVTYTVTVLAADSLGNAVLENVVTGTDSNCPEPAITDPDDPDFDPDCHNSTLVGAVHYLKTVDPDDPLALQPGDTYAYTVTVSNIGATDLEELSFTDDLTDVLDNATFEVGSETADIGTVEFDGTDEVTWNGDLGVGQVATITYEVTIDTPPSGDTLINGVLGDGPGSNCPPPGPATHADCFKQVPQPLINTVKTSDAVGDVDPGDIVGYEFTVSNDGTGPARIFEVRDHLSGVLDDASYNDDLTLVSGPGEVVFDPVNQEIVWTGELDVGESAIVAYSVVVNDAADLGDGVLRNAVTSPDCFAPPTFDPGDPLYDPDCVTEDPIRAWSGQKTSDAAGNVGPGDTVSYTITVENTGGVDLTDIGLTDDLSGVLDDATLDGDSVAASFGDVVFDPLADELTWEVNPPDVFEVGQNAIISYSVTVNDADSLGGAVLVNAVTGPMNCPDPEITDPEDPDFDPDCVLITDVEAWTVAKDSDASDPVLPGDVVTYTLTVENTGNAALSAEDVLVTDDLSGVLDDATYNGDADQGAVFNDPILSWSDALAIGEQVAITYSITVNDAVSLGDGVLTNAVTGGDCPDPAVTDPSDPDFDETCVVIDDIEAWTVVKSSDSGNPVLPGDVVTYTLTVSNTGNVPLTAADVEVTDDLSGVLGNASYNDDADQGAVFNDPIVSWSGDLAVGQEVTITYSVTVDDATALGDGRLTNAVTGGDCPDPAVTDPSDPDFDETCVVIDDIEAWTVVKSSDSGNPVLPGDVVTYTLTVSNTGNVALMAENVIVSDDLSGVLDDATFDDDITMTSGIATYLAPILSWTGDLAVDEVVTITYSVTVNGPADLGDGQLTNAVSGSPNCPDPAVTDPQDPDFDPDCVVIDDIEAWVAVKSSDAGSPVLPGDVITYSITATNTGNVHLDDPMNLPALEDDLSGALDDAVYNGDADSGGEGSLAYLEPVLSWQGGLAVGQAVTIAYTVTVNSAAEMGDGVLVNAITGSPNCPDPAVTDPADPDFDPDCVLVSDVEAYTVDKAVQAPQPVLPGDVVGYTVVVTNTGGTDLTGASFEDDLSGVLDDASYNNDADSGAIGTVTYTEPILSWTGDLEVGQSATVDYTVTVDDPITGDFSLENTVTGGDCDPCETVTPLPGIHFSKQIVAPDGVAELLPGDTFTYVVTVTNTGLVDLVDQSFEDDLSDVLDDASYNNDAAANIGDVSYSEPILTWEGDLAIGQVATVTYTVTIDDPVTGDGMLRNGVASDGPNSNCVPPDSSDPACHTEFPQAVVEVAKELVDPSVIEPGSVVTYRITAHNRGGATAAGELIEDDLSGVLDDASYNGDAAVSKGTVGVAAPVLAWTVDIDPGETVELVYSVTVNEASQIGDGRLVNSVTGGINCPEGEDCDTDHGVAAVRYEKTIVAPTSGEAEPGDTVTYRITATNLGGTDLTGLEFTDDLSSVLEYSSWVGDHSASDGQVTFAHPTLAWSGDLPAGETASVTYSVILHENAPAETAVLNVVVGNGPGSNCPSNPGGPECEADFDILSTGVTGPLPFTGLDLLRLLLIALAALTVGVLIVATTRRREPTG